MTRRAHWLQPVKSAVYPRELIAFDTESVERRIDASTVEHVLAFGWACYSRFTSRGTWTEPQWFRFTEPYQLWQWVQRTCRPKQQTYMYCHNVNFDWQITSMCQVMRVMGWQCDQAIIEDPPNAFRWRKDAKTLRCLDSFNYFYASLKQIGDRIGLPKLDMPGDWSNTELGDTYCKRDTLIVLRAIQQWIDWLRKHRLGSLSISLAAQSMSAYKHRFLQYPIYIDDNDDARELERAGYFGGRVEAWSVGVPVHDVITLDINSMYPSLMRDNDFACRLHGIYKRVKLKELTRWLRKYSVCARVVLNTDIPAYPERSDGKLLFPVGEFETVLTTPELAYALENGHVVSCSEATVYDKFPLFRSYMTELYNLRLGFMEQGDDAAVYFIKKMINSLYGKWAQRGGHEEIIGETDDLSLRVEDEIDLHTGERYRIRYIAGVIMRRSLDAESRQSLPIISSEVTAHGRLLLWKLALQAGIDNVHYMDTDSLHVNHAGLIALEPYIDETRLGYLKVEQHIGRALYYGPKDYQLDDARKIKGVRASATEVAPSVYEQEQWVSIRGSCVAQWSGGPLVRRVRKRLSRVYSKGEVDASGRVLPFRRSTR